MLLNASIVNFVWTINLIVFSLSKACVQLNELFLTNIHWVIVSYQTLPTLYVCEVICHYLMGHCPFLTDKTTRIDKDN